MATAVSADGTVIGYESVGAGQPLLLVHGSTGTRARWSTVQAPLAQRYTVHAMDRRAPTTRRCTVAGRCQGDPRPLVGRLRGPLPR
jgi:hypothetical protein